jgi:hypothetical protein
VYTLCALPSASHLAELIVEDLLGEDVLFEDVLVEVNSQKYAKLFKMCRKPANCSQEVLIYFGHC